MPESVNQVVILIMFVIPGFVFARAFGFAVPLRPRETAAMILGAC